MDTHGGAGWFADPFGRHGERFFDGGRWTPYVKDDEQQSMDEPVAPALQPPAPSAPGAPASPGRRSLFTESVLVVRQRTKLVELVDEYDVLDEHGLQVGTVREVGQGAGRKALRALTSLDQHLTHRLEVLDADGSLALGITRRTPDGARPGTVVVNDGMGRELGRFEQQWRLGRVRFGLHEAFGRPLGYLDATNWRAWDFRVTDLTGREVATISKSWRGLVTEWLTTADAYVVRLEQPLDEPLRSLAVASALAVDTVLKQQDHSGRYTGTAAGIGGAVIGSILG